MNFGGDVFQSVIKPKVTSTAGWEDLGPIPARFTQGFEGRYWRYVISNSIVLGVMSAVEVAREAHEIDGRPYYHLSVSKQIFPGGTHRATRNEARFVCKAFGMLDAEEDNHVPGGQVRNYWLPVAESLIGKECPCKEDEPAMVEDKGDYIWRGIT